MLIQIKIIFSFMDHILNMRRGYLWDCLFPGQYSRTFYRIWKVSSRSKSQIHYPKGCPRRHHTPHLFIYLFHPTLIVWIWQIPVGIPHGPHTALCVITSFVTSSWNSWCSKDASISNDDSQRKLVQRLLLGVLKLGLHGHHSSGEGDVAQPQPIPWPVNHSIRNSHSHGEMCWNIVLLKWHLLHNPTVDWLWYDIIPHLIHVTPLTVPSRNMGQWYKRQLHVHYHHVCWVVLHIMRVMRILFSPKKHFKTRSCSKLYIHLKRELSHETRLPEIIPTTKHTLCDIVSCQYHWVQLQTVAKMTLSPGPSCGETWSNVVPQLTKWNYAVLQVPLIISKQTCVTIIQWKQQPQHRSPFGTLVDCYEENPSHSST